MGRPVYINGVSIERERKGAPPGDPLAGHGLRADMRVRVSAGAVVSRHAAAARAKAHPSQTQLATPECPYGLWLQARGGQLALAGWNSHESGRERLT